jgi:hypothetical protein
MGFEYMSYTLAFFYKKIFYKIVDDIKFELANDITDI